MKTEEEFLLEVVDILMRYGAKRALILTKIEEEKRSEKVETQPLEVVDK